MKGTPVVLLSSKLALCNVDLLDWTLNTLNPINLFLQVDKK